MTAHSAEVERAVSPAGLTAPARPVDLLAVGASTGGPQALARLLAGLPAGTRAAVLVVQHMADGFIEGLAEWLDGICPLPVAVAADGSRLRPGSVSVVPSGVNLVVGPALRVRTETPPATQFHVPGIDAAFGSVAATVGARAAGVLLTGMGRDGAAGLRRMRDRGAVTIAQDEASSVVYGMPAAAMELAAATVQLTLATICWTVTSLLTPTEDGT